MGQELSQHQLYVEQLKQNLKTRGVKVKIQHLLNFFDFIKDICPWFPQEGTIDVKIWKRVGDAFQDYFKTFGSKKIPVTAFSYWSWINDILNTQSTTVVAAVEEGHRLL